MSETVQPPGQSQRTRAVGYALNVFPVETLADLWPVLQDDVPRIKERVFPHEPFPIELRFSEQIVRELLSDPEEFFKLMKIGDSANLALVAVNGFVMPHFHGERVKERVYLPAWHESDARRRFTNACVDWLAPLAWRDADFVSVSVPFGALKPVTMDAVAPNILRCAEHAAWVHQQIGTRVMIALEPEPGLCVETTAEAIEFFERFAPDHLRAYLGVNFDLAHQLVEFEDLSAAIAQLTAAGVPIAKIHVSNAAEFTELRPFYEDSIYLHQVTGLNAAGQRAYFSLDWPTEPPPANLVRFRCHYHLPVCEMPGQPVGSTLREVEAFLTNTLATIHPSIPAIIETYTWPQQLRGRDRLVENICRELNWVREKICLSPP